MRRILGAGASLSLWLSATLVPVTGVAAEPEALRIGVMKTGTVRWELDVIEHRGLGAEGGFRMELTELANNQAIKVALQGGAVDVIVADWIWVSRQRAEGRRYTFAPYSATVGAILVPADSPVREVRDLAGRKVGICFGPLDKTWILARAQAQRAAGMDLDAEVEKVFGAPPLVNKQIELGRLDGVINYWHYVARLEVAGMRRIAGADDLLRALGVEVAPPFLGYVFDDALGESHGDALRAFLAASREAKRLLCEDDAEWARIAPMVRAETPAIDAALRRSYCAGRPKAWGNEERDAAAEVFAILAEIGGSDLVGKAGELQPGTFWDQADF
jgi:NitT/TauT family transport system substrate-binding protein